MTQEPPAREHDSDLRGGTREAVDRSSCRFPGVDLFLPGGKPRVAIARRNGGTIVAGARN
jgi:hypothetical protein